MSTVLETMRSAHADIERAEKRISELLGQEPKTHREKLNLRHEISQLLDLIIRKEDTLAALYADEDGAKREESEAIKGEGTALLDVFYAKLKETRDYHIKFPNIPVTEESLISTGDAEVAFSGEEGYGKYIDLHWSHDCFVNLPRVKAILLKDENNPIAFDYTTYLMEFYLFDDNWNTKGADYKQYLDDLLNYLTGFRVRANPLDDHEGIMAEIDAKFEELVAFKKFQSWQAIRDGDDVKNLSQLVMGSSDLKQEDENDPLYCKYCKKKFAKDSVFQGHLKGKKHIKAVAASGDAGFKEEIARTEYRIYRLACLMTSLIDRTRNFIVSKQSKNWEEIQADLEDAEEVEEESSDEEDGDEDEIIQGIKDYPVGWDGKPIPYWLYKLHGLGVEYKCEICGNASYMGRRNFERHFQEAKHTHGLRCLDISNTKHFAEITKIKDARALQKKLEEDKKKAEWNPDDQMEFEDNEGNVVSKKTYEMMKRQGLLDPRR